MALAIKSTATVRGEQAEKLRKTLQDNPKKQTDKLSFEVNEKELIDFLKKQK